MKVLQQIEKFIRSVVQVVGSKLDRKSIVAIEHYLDYAEYEMAFEGLFILIMKLKDTPEIDLKKSKDVALLLKLHETSIIDFDFWNKFEHFLNENGVL